MPTHTAKQSGCSHQSGLRRDSRGAMGQDKHPLLPYLVAGVIAIVPLLGLYQTLGPVGVGVLAGACLGALPLWSVVRRRRRHRAIHGKAPAARTEP